MSERASFPESARKAQLDLELHYDQMWQFRTGMSYTGSGCVQSERSNVVKNSVAMGASAVAGVTVMALKMFTRGSRD